MFSFTRKFRVEGLSFGLHFAIRLYVCNLKASHFASRTTKNIMCSQTRFYGSPFYSYRQMETRMKLVLLWYNPTSFLLKIMLCSYVN